MAVEQPRKWVSVERSFQFEADLSYKTGDPSVHLWVVGENKEPNPEAWLSIFCHLDHPWPCQECSLRFGHIDGSIHYCRLPAGVFQDQAQTVHGALCVLT